MLFKLCTVTTDVNFSSRQLSTCKTSQVLVVWYGPKSSHSDEMKLFHKMFTRIFNGGSLFMMKTLFLAWLLNAVGFVQGLVSQQNLVLSQIPRTSLNEIEMITETEERRIERDDHLDCLATNSSDEYDLPWHISAIFIVFGVSFVGAFVTLLMRRFLTAKVVPFLILKLVDSHLSCHLLWM